ncbi:toxin Cry1Ac domain D-VI-related protein [Listeria booriae]|uniref:Pesticidal crystal protein Cry1Aa domain-containing protein n=1 Tax=Listeria booriae TaxID=1552123 RepID=A0A7X0ZTR2_9LIST|nr:toxin Cry1Ac domain D-VI-related protein [Listeria booriae]MBC2285307.1 hypothetical protein [Listeria booriae]MBC2293924.1 hypothetical protein [Listeria booriae]MBC2309457.1 hypothetical protein [Listeria booriae]
MKKQDLLKKGTSIALVATIIGSQLLTTVPYNVFAAESGVGTQALPTNSATVSTWPELQAALTSVAVTDIYLNADITIGASVSLATSTTKHIHGNGYILNANSKELRLTKAGTAAVMEDVRITNTTAYGLIWGTVADLEVTYKDVDHSGIQMIYLPSGNLIIDGTVTSNTTTQEVFQGKDLTIKDNATAYFNAIAGTTIDFTGALNVGTNATLTTRSKGPVSINGAASTKIVNLGNMDVKSEGQRAILLNTSNGSIYAQKGSSLKAVSASATEEAILAVDGNIYVESGATLEAESNGTKGTINAGGTIKLAQGSNFSLTNFNSAGAALASYPTPVDVILQSSQGISTWNRGTVMNPKPTATYPGVFDAQFTISGYLNSVTQKDLASNNMQFVNSYKTAATGKIVGGSFASDEQDVAKSAVDALFTDSTKTGIKTITDQAAIDAAKDLVNKVSDPTVKADLQKDIDKAQSLLDAKKAAAAAEKAKQDAALKAVNELFNSNTPLTDAIKPTTDQAAIDAAKALVNAVTDPTVKAALQKDLNRAQELLDAKNAAAAAAEKAKQDAARKAADELFNNNTPASNAIKPTTDQAAIDAAKALVNKVTDPTTKAAIQADIDKAQSLLDAKTAAAAAEKAKQDAARKAADELFNNNTPASNAIKPTTDQAAIDAAKALVNKVTDPTTKAAIQADIDKAQQLLNARNVLAIPQLNPMTEADTVFSGKLDVSQYNPGTIRIYINNAPATVVAVDANGNFSYNIGSRKAGDIIGVDYKDRTGQYNATTKTSITVTAVSSNVSISNMTENNDTITGQAAPNAKVRYVVGGQAVNVGYADANGNFTMYIGKQKVGTVVGVEVFDSATNKYKAAVTTTVTAGTGSGAFTPPVINTITEGQGVVTGTVPTSITTVRVWVNGVAQTMVSATNGSFTWTKSNLKAGDKVKVDYKDATGAWISAEKDVTK